MTIARMQERIRLAAVWSWGLMAFCLPFSTALTLIFSVIGTLFGLAGFDWEAFKKVIRNPISVLCVALFAWLALSMLWSIAPRDEMIEGISKYRKLLYAPLIAMLLVSTRVKPNFLMNCFVTGCLVVCFGSLFSSIGLADLLLGPQNGGGGWLLGGSPDKAWFFIGPPEKPTFGRAHIAQSAFLVFAATLLFYVGPFKQLLESRYNLRTSVPLYLVFSLLVYVVLNLGGLTGYVLLVAACALIVIDYIRSSNTKFGSSTSLVVGCVMVLTATLATHHTVQSRLIKSANDLHGYLTSDKNTSEGLRLRFWGVAISNARYSPIVGYGAGSYAEVFSRDTAQPRELKDTRPHPHSEPSIILVQGGLIALTFYIGLLFNVSKIFLRKKSITATTGTIEYSGLVVVWLLLALDGLFNSVIWDLAEGHIFSLITGVIVAIEVKRTLQLKSKEA